MTSNNNNKDKIQSYYDPEGEQDELERTMLDRKFGVERNGERVFVCLVHSGL